MRKNNNHLLILNKKRKKFYLQPSVEQVKLDTSISILMSSGGQTSPTGDPEGIGQSPIHYIQKIFKFGA